MKERDSVREAMEMEARPQIVTDFVKDVAFTLRSKMDAGAYSDTHCFRMSSRITPVTWPFMEDAVTEQLVAAFKEKDWEVSLEWRSLSNYISLTYTIK